MSGPKPRGDQLREAGSIGRECAMHIQRGFWPPSDGSRARSECHRSNQENTRSEGASPWPRGFYSSPLCRDGSGSHTRGRNRRRPADPEGSRKAGYQAAAPAPQFSDGAKRRPDETSHPALPAAPAARRRTDFLSKGPAGTRARPDPGPECRVGRPGIEVPGRGNAPLPSKRRQRCPPPMTFTARSLQVQTAASNADKYKTVISPFRRSSLTAPALRTRRGS